MKRLSDVGSALSRTLNAAVGGSRFVTFSAGSFGERKGTRFGDLSVMLLDFIAPQGDDGLPHCESAWKWHESVGLTKIK